MLLVSYFVNFLGNMLTDQAKEKWHHNALNDRNTKYEQLFLLFGTP
jgi:hypothetical protein